jgi:hypothetical protein
MKDNAPTLLERFSRLPRVERLRILRALSVAELMELLAGPLAPPPRTKKGSRKC